MTPSAPTANPCPSLLMEIALSGNVCPVACRSQCRPPSGVCQTVLPGDPEIQACWPEAATARKFVVLANPPGKGFGAPLLEGDVDWPKVMDELEKVGYVGWGTAEITGGDKERLTWIADRMNKIFAS